MSVRDSSLFLCAAASLLWGCSQAPSEPPPVASGASAPDTRPEGLPESADVALGLRLPVRVKLAKRTDTFAEFTVASTPAEVRGFLERQLSETKVTPLQNGGYELLGRLTAGEPGPILHWVSITKYQGLVRVLVQTRPDPRRFVPPPRDGERLEGGEVVIAGSAGEGGSPPVGSLPNVEELIDKQRETGASP